MPHGLSHMPLAAAAPVRESKKDCTSEDLPGNSAGLQDQAGKATVHWFIGSGGMAQCYAALYCIIMQLAGTFRKDSASAGVFAQGCTPCGIRETTLA